MLDRQLPTPSCALQVEFQVFREANFAGVRAGPNSMLSAPMIIVTTKPTTGPLRPKSNSWSLLAGGPFREMRAPKVPMGGGPGMKYGKVASSLW